MTAHTSANPPTLRPVLGIIGGSGIYALPDLEDQRQETVDTPFGAPSSPLLYGTLQGQPVVFLARHGIGHTLSPSEVNYRANLWALKLAGAPRILSISACGSLREDFAPGEVVIPDNLFDFTRGRANSFFGDGIVGHVSVANPFCAELSGLTLDAVTEAGGKVHAGGKLITIEGPRFSTKAESNVFRTWGMDLIGMTASPEAFLAREAGLCYAAMAHVTDYDVWHVSAEPVTVDTVVETLNRNTRLAQEAMRLLVRALPASRDACDCAEALASAVLTAPAAISPAARARLEPLLGQG
jgi:5'-methylthioadenosine phosphorylase